MKGVGVVIVGILSLVSFASTGPVQPYNLLDDFIMAIINNFKNIIVDGNPCLGIPPLDPLYMPGFPLNISTPLLKMKGNVADIDSIGLKSLEVTSLSCNLITLAVDLVMNMPSFHIGGQYDVEGMALIIFPIYGRGPFSLDIDNFQINGHGQLGARLNGSLVMRNLDFTMEMQSMAIKFEGLLGGGELGDVINEIIQIIGLDVYNTVRAILHDTLMTVMIDFINFSLKDVLLSDIIGGIIQPPQPDPGCGGTTFSSGF